MSHLECPNCSLRISALRAPLDCPRCQSQSGLRVELVPAPMSIDRSGQQTRSAPRGRMQPFGLSVSEVPPGCVRVEVQGELDLAVTDRLRQALGRAVAHREVLLDLARCDFIDASSIATILHAESGLTAEGGRLVVVGPRGQVLRVLTVTGLIDRGLVFAGAAEALAGPPAVVAA